MSKTIDAIFENGVFKPITPISVSEHKKVTLIIADENEELKVQHIHICVKQKYRYSKRLK